MFKNRKGFTLIELLIVVVIIGILAAIAIPKFANTKEKAIIASMKSDLRNVVTAQEAFFSDNGAYANAIGPVQTTTDAAFVPTTGNVVTTKVNGTGWDATADNPLTTKTCVIGGNGILVGTPPTEGAPVCA